MYRLCLSVYACVKLCCLHVCLCVHVCVCVCACVRVRAASDHDGSNILPCAEGGVGLHVTTFPAGPAWLTGAPCQGAHSLFLLSQVEAVIHPRFLAELLSSEPQLDLLALAEKLEQEEGLSLAEVSRAKRDTGEELSQGREGTQVSQGRGGTQYKGTRDSVPRSPA